MQSMGRVIGQYMRERQHLYSNWREGEDKDIWVHVPGREGQGVPTWSFLFLSKVDVHLLRAGDRSANSKDEDEWKG